MKKPKKVDISSKRLIGIDPTRWVEWVSEIPNVTVKEIISSDFQWLSHFSYQLSVISYQYL
ncbi:hypothetical protein [Okeania sp. SIO3I5]|uniref:hypothetical protein n=1 Tax=Okeania sp. SIO3I5 TaxID=2607805 RepID=UPI0025F16BD3|nr:hypothetical protein [Okeania sp. SIO3I5]